MKMENLKSDIVITGFSGRFPESDNVEEFKKNLFEGIDMVTSDDRRWPVGLMGLPERNGKLKDLASFDASFFGVHAKQADVMDPQLRILLEVTHEAIIDAGINPVDLRGSNTGVFIGVSESDSVDYFSSDSENINGYPIIGCCRAMFANRISYSFNFTGPSLVLDTACSSSIYALHQAVMAMRAGQCDAAIVGGVTLILKPNVCLHFQSLNMLSPDGMCRAFDADGKGYVRSETVAVVFLQRAPDAKRIYASVINTRTNTDGYKNQGITFPSGELQLKLERETYEEAGVDPREVSYVEAHGTGTPAGDPQEVNSIVQLFCKDRSTPLLIGSVKSNMGHSESGSGLCSLVKVLISMENKKLPGNLHFNTPNPNIPGLFDGRLKVVDKTTPWEGGLAGINSFGFGGANAHAILKSFSKKNPPTLANKFPKIVGVSARTEEACQLLLENAAAHKENDEFIGLIQNVFKQSIPGYNYRGYSILNKDSNQEINECEANEKRPVWFVFSGMGTQWPECGKELMVVPAFAESIKRSAAYLKPFGLDLLHLINSSVENDLYDIINSFVIITSIQIALVDLLASLDIHPDGIVGLSAGEMACAYADGALTQEQTILAAYWRGKSIVDTKIIPGKMAAVGLTWEELTKICPKDIDLASHTALDSITISGPEDSVIKFGDELLAKEIYVKPIYASAVPFHSRYITEAGPKLQKSMENIIPHPKLRSSKWLSSSVPESSWGTDLNKYCDAKYFVNNLLLPVYFYETLKYIPDNAITIEIAPHRTLRSVLRKSLAPTVLNLALHQRYHPNNVEFFLLNLGQLFNAGVDIDFSKLYAPIEYPVSTGTPMLNSLIGWDHSQKWEVAYFGKSKVSNGETIIELNLAKDENKYLAGHRVEGRVIFPATGYFVLVWKTFAKILGTHFEQLPVVLENVNLLRATILPKEGSVKLLINIFHGTGDFEICEGNSLVVSGRIYVPEKNEKHQLELPHPEGSTQEYLDLTQEDFYKMLQLRGLEYSGVFQGIKSSNNILSTGELYWKDNWVSFMDTMIQYNLMAKHQTKDLFLPTRLQYLSIDPQKHLAMKDDSNVYKINYYPELNVVKSGGVEFRDMKLSFTARKQQVERDPKLENYFFIPYDNLNETDADANEKQFQAMSIFLQLMKENLQVMKVKGVEICTNADHLIAPTLVEILLNEPLISYDFAIATSLSLDTYLPNLEQFDVEVINKDISVAPVGQDLHFVIAENVLSKPDSVILSNLIKSIKAEGFLVLIESNGFNPTVLDKFGMIVVSNQSTPGKSYLLIKRKEEPINPTVIRVTEKNFNWVEELKSTLKRSEQTGEKILMLSQGEPELGIVGLMTCVRKESDILNNVFYIFIQDDNAPEFSLTNPFYTSQIQKYLMSNVYKNGKWGSYRHLWLKKDKLELSTETNHAFVNTLTRGDLTSLRWIEAPLKYEKPNKNSSKELCEVYYAPLNFRDIMLATGKLPPDALPGNLVGEECILGLEFAGRDSKGQRVMGLVPARGLATTVLSEKTGFLWEIPKTWSLKEAATIPVCYSTSYYALFIRGRLRPGESVLIHAGSGGVGLASISIALHAGCKVFTTVGTKDKREFLKKTFPQLTDRCIGNSRDTSFEQMIKLETNGEGVDVVLNSLSEEKLKASIRCLRRGGRFLEIGKFDLSNDSPLGMSVFLKNTCFHGILLDELFEKNCSSERQEVIQLVAEGIVNGAVKPLPSTIFNEHQLEQGFRFMASGKHIGKVLFEIRPEESQKISPAIPKKITAVSRTYFHPEKSYILVGGLGGFGMELAHWMISRGAKFLILSSRSGVRTGYQSIWMRQWKQMGISVTVSTDDVISIDGCKKLIEKANKLAPVGGIYNLAGVLHNDILENLNDEYYSMVTRPKIDATKNLDAISRKLCPLVDQFVIFSSVSGGRGMPGQTNYGLANSAMERLVEKRRDDGLPGLGIQWGPIGDVGMLIAVGGDNDTILAGTLAQRMSSCLNVMDIFLQNEYYFAPTVSCMVVEDKMRFKQQTSAQLGLSDVIGNILGIKDVKTVSQKSTFLDMGLDSLIAAEIKQTLERTYDIIMSIPEIRSLTFAKLKEIESKDEKSPATKEKTATTSNGVEEFTPNEQYFEVLNLAETELAPKEVVVHLNPQNNCTSDPIFFIHVSNMKNIAMKINHRPAYGLQCTKDIPFESIGDLAKYFINSMKKIQHQGPYTIVAYSWGTIVALEMASILEAAGEKLILKFIDGSHDFVLQHMESMDKYYKSKNYLSEDWKHQCFAFFSRRLNSNANFIELFNVLKTMVNVDDMLNKVVEYVGDSPFKPEDIKTAAFLSYKKLVAAKSYKFTGKISSPVLLIKASMNFISQNEDYGLSKICAGELKIKEISGDHKSIVSVANIDNLLKYLNL